MARETGSSSPAAYVGVAILAAVTLVCVVLALRPVDTPSGGSSATPVAPAQSPSTTSTVSAAVPQEPLLTRPEGRPLKVVVAGDSLTFGLYASAEEKAWRPLTVAALAEGGPVDATEGGEDGDKAKTVLDSIAPAVDTDLVLIEIGTNDVYRTPDNQFSRQYEQLIDKVTSAAPNATLLCLGVWQNVDANRNFDPMIQTPCEAAGGTFVPLYDLFEDPANRGPAGVPSFGGDSDTFHPNDTGHSAISQRVLATLGL